MSEFVHFLHEVFRNFGTIQARKMFSGYGIYCDGTMFALVANKTLYLKADAAMAHYFEDKGLGQFEYARGEKTVSMSYYLAPEDIFDDADEAAQWANRSFEAALRSKRKSFIRTGRKAARNGA
jgi:DNA transformation protein